MGLASAIRRGLADVRERASIENPIYPLTATRLVELLGGPYTDSGEQVTAKRSLTMSPVWRSVDLIAGTIAATPIHAYRQLRAGVDTEKTDETDLFPILRDPHPEMTDFELRHWIWVNIELNGNAFLWKRRWVADNRMPKPGEVAPPIRYLFPIQPIHVRVGRASDGTKWFEVTDEQTGDTIPASTNEILHIPNLCHDGVLGLAPVDMARNGLGWMLAMERYGALFYGRGGMMSGVLQTDRRLTPDAADQIQSRWQEMAGGLGNAHKVAVIDQGAKYVPISVTPETAQWIEGRSFGVLECARWWGIPPHLLAETSGSTSWGSGLEELTRGMKAYALRPRFAKFEQRYTKELLPRAVFAEHRHEGLVEVDALAQAQIEQIRVQEQIITPREVRGWHNYPPAPPELVRAWEASVDSAGGAEGKPLKLPSPTNNLSSSKPGPGAAASPGKVTRQNKLHPTQGESGDQTAHANSAPAYEV